MKIAIIGAGINGLYLAWKLSEKGFDVTVFEKKNKIGKEVCSGLFSERILEFIPQSKNLIENQIDYCLIHFPKKTIKIEFSKKFLLMSHFQLDNLVAQLAKNCGAKIFLKKEISASDLILFEKKYDKIIGCDGAFSLVRKYLKLKEPEFFLGIQKIVSQDDHSNFVETWPTKSGFIWKIPRKKVTEWGIIEKPKKAKKFFEDFLKDKKIFLTPEMNFKLKSAPIPQGLIFCKNEKITLCGDAAGFVKPWSGGGVIWGLTAANFILKNFPDFIKYQKEAKRFFRPKFILSKFIKKIVYFFGYNFSFFLPKNFKVESDFLFLKNDNFFII